jgi:predicted NAD-dependent protein-ADP-ribosyltransferase YbiA (DUF1768 family)
MVRSRLDSSINYPELKSLDPLDTEEHNYKAPLYEASVLGINTIIGIGQVNNTFISKNIVYIPIYLIKNDKVISQIGVYEMMQDTIPSLLDDEDEINPEKAPPPLIYSFVTKSLIQKAVYIPKNLEDKPKPKLKPIEKEKTSSRPASAIAVVSKSLASASAAVGSENEDTDSDDEFMKAAIRASLIDQVPADVPLKSEIPRIPVQTVEQFEADKGRYKRNKDQPWIQSYYENNYFQTVRNPGGGDCFFYAICQAVRSIDSDTDISVIKLRRMLSAAVTENEYRVYRDIYDQISKEISDLNSKYQENMTQNDELKERLAGAKSILEKREIKALSTTLLSECEEIKLQVRDAKENLELVRFMKGVKSLSDMRSIILTSDYWVDEWGISALEFLLNFKFIILSQRDYNGNNRKPFTEINVINCGLQSDKNTKDAIVRTRDKMHAQGDAQGDALVVQPVETRETGEMAKSSSKEDYQFNPDFYIIFSHTGMHYELVTYRNVAMFTFAEIPYCVKLQIATRCLQGKSLNGNYSHIPQFVLFMKDLGIESALSAKELDASIADQTLSSNPHYSDAVQLSHYENAADQLPGKAQGDSLSTKDAIGLFPLSSGGNKGDKNWRRKISNEWCEPFTLDGHRWLSVEHYYQANKFLKRFPEFYLLFTMDAHKKSKYYDETSILSRIAHDVNLATVAGKKIPKTKIDGKMVTLRPEEVVIDSDFFNGRHARVLEDGTMAKFSQNDNLAKILLMTNNAKLINYRHMKEPTVSIHLMRVRSKLRTKKGGVNVFETNI